MRTPILAAVAAPFLACLVGIAHGKERTDPGSVIRQQVERASAVGGDGAATCALSTQVEVMMQVFADPHVPAFEYYRELFAWLEEHGTEEALPSLEMWLNSDVHWKFTRQGYRNLVWDMQDNATLAWYRVKSRNMTDAEKGGLLLSLVSPGKCSTLAEFDAIPVEEYGTYLPHVEERFLEFLTDKNAVLQGKHWPSYMYVRGPSWVGRIMAAVPDLHVPDALEDVILAQAGTYGHFAYLSYVRELLRLRRAGEIEDDGWVDEKVAKLRQHLPGLLDRATTDDARYRYVHVMDVLKCAEGIPALARVGRKLMRESRRENNGTLFSIAVTLCRGRRDKVAEEYLREYVAWAKEMRKKHPKGNYRIAATEDALRRWPEEAESQKDAE